MGETRNKMLLQWALLLLLSFSPPALFCHCSQPYATTILSPALLTLSKYSDEDIPAFWFENLSMKRV